MSDIYTIAKSGLKAYRESLATTGQNIANVGNEAYARRDTTISEIKSGSPDVLQLSENISFGVKVDGITRAFDQFIDMQLHSAKSGFSFSQAQTQIFNQLETIVRPSVGSVSERINEFFSSLSTVALDPSDLAARSEVINSSKALVHSFQSVAKGIIDLRTLVSGNIDAAVSDANSYLKQLANIQSELLANKSSNNVRNDLLDQRDSVLSKLSEIIEIKTQYKSHGEIEVLAGAEGQGQTILSGFNAKEFSVGEIGGFSKIFVVAPGTDTGIKIQVSSGRIAGLLSSENALGKTKGNLDDLTQKFVSEVNQVQTSGLDLDGEIGEQVFSLDAVEISKFSRSESTVQLEVLGFSEKFLNDSISIDYIAENDFWSLKDNEGNSLGNFKGSITFDGVTFNVVGKPAIGDRFDVRFTDQKTENISLKLNDAKLLAAASYYLPVRHPENSSNATLSAEFIGEPSETSISDLTKVLIGANNSANPITFRENGVLGILKNVDSIESLVGLKQQTKLQISHPISDLESSSQVSITLGATTHTFSIGALVDEISTYSDLATFLNKGVIKTDGFVNGEQLSFSDLGLRAGGTANSFLVASAYLGNDGIHGELKGGAIEDTPGLLVPGNTEMTNLQVFTKEGVQIAGTPLSDAQISNLISEENGFSREAKYTASNLVASEATQYISADVNRITTDGYHVVNITGLAKSNLTDSNFTVDEMSNIPIERAKMSAPLIVQASNLETTSIEPTPGMMAGQIATLLNEEVSQFGIQATAYNHVELYEIPNEIIDFNLRGNNASGLNVSVDLSSGNIKNLVNAINSLTLETGITASRSATNAIVLVHEEGNEIAITDVNISNAESIKIRQLDQYGEIIKSPQSIAFPDISTGDYAIIGGQIELRSPSDFKVINDGVELLSNTEEFANGFITRKYLPNVESTEYTFQSLRSVDSASVGLDGFNAVAASSSYEFEIVGDNPNTHLSAQVLGATGEDLSGATIAARIAKDLRQMSLQTGFVGNSFSFNDGLPKNGESLNFRLGDQIYKATLNGIPDYSLEGDNVIIGGTTYNYVDALKQIVTKSYFSVAGPEAERIQVGFREVDGSEFELYAFAKDGIISGHTLQLSSDNPDDILSSFHIDDNSSGFIQGSDFDITQPVDLIIGQLLVGDTLTDIRFNNGAVTPAAIGDIGISIENTGVDTGRIVVSIPHSISDQDIRLKATENSSDFGINTASTQLTLTEDGFNLSEYGNDRLEVSANVQSLASEMISISGLQGEDLIVVATGNTRPSILGSVTAFSQTLNPREITAKIISDDGKKIELLDTNSGDLLGFRTLSNTNSFHFRGFEWQFDGFAAKDDLFTLTTNGNRADDASNILRFTKLSTASDETGRGGYAQIYSDLVTDTGFRSREAEQRLETNEAIQEVALDRKSEFSGVDLDAEAARLIEQQQAYQAMARVLSTAKELVDTILRSI